MPPGVTAVLAAEDDSNKMQGVMRFLQCLLVNISGIRIAYLCDFTVSQVWKLDGEGNHFCGYRNAQMLVVQLQNKTVLQMQELIELAWEAGHNTHGKIETGGIKGTRKHVGTSEVCVCV